MFDHSYCQNVHSQSQNRCFKEFANFWQKIPATKHLFARIDLTESGQLQRIRAEFTRIASLIHIILTRWVPPAVATESIVGLLALAQGRKK